MGITVLLFVDLINFILYFTFPDKILSFKKGMRWLTFVMLLLNLVEAFIVRTNMFMYMNPIKTLIYLIQYAIYFYFAYKDSIKNKATAFLMLILCIVTSDILAVTILSSVNINYSETYNGIPGHLIGNVTCAIFTYILMVAVSLIYNRIKYKNISNQMWQFHIIIISQVLFASVACFSVFKSNTIESLLLQTPGYGIMFFITIIVSVIGDVCLYRILMTNSQNFELKNQLEVIKTKNELELEYYEKLRKNIAETRKLNHDFSNILAVVESMVTTDSSANNQDLSLDIIAEIKQTLLKSKIKYFCENELVNLIVINKSEEIEQTGADFSANLYIPQNIGINNLDLCRIFTNLLDNAREACENNQDKQNSFVVLTAIVNENCFTVTCENYCDSQVKVKNEKLISTKDNHHGLGTEIIKEIVKTYDGNYTYSYNNKIFSSSLIIKLTQK